MNKGLRQVALRRRHRAIRKRRGVLLIIVLSLLVMFALIGFTFVLVAGNYSRAARANQRVALTDFQGPKLVEQAMYDLLRGTNNTNNSLLEFDAADKLNPQKWLCQCLLEDLYGPESFRAQLTADAQIVDGTTNLRDLILLQATSPSGLFSTLQDYYSGQVITMVDGPAGLISSRIVRYFPTDANNAAFYVERFRTGGDATALPLTGNRLIINGRPHNRALGDANNAMHADEDWDAPDAMNPFLAFVPALANDPYQVIPSFTDRAIIDTDTDGLIDSRFDPSAHAGALPMQRTVDNDRDGLFDSVWIDMGYPAKATADGRRYMPLFAILCLDMDGRVNLNAHGAAAHADPTYTNGSIITLWADPNFNGDNSKNLQPRGLGLGPADVSLQVLFDSNDTFILTSERNKSDHSGDGAGASQPGLATYLGDDLLLKVPGLDNDYRTHATTPGGYGSRIDLHGDVAIGVDFAGQPIVTGNRGATPLDEISASPYRLNLVEPDGFDSPFTATDLERILRWTDTDAASQSQRIPNLTGSSLATTFQNADKRRNVTTHSFRVPSWGLPGPANSAQVGHFLNKVYDKLDANGGFTTAKMEALFSPDLLRGGKMDLNRLWGNNMDDDGVAPLLVVDDPAELAATAQPVFDNVYNGRTGYTTPNGDFDGDGDTAANAGGRHLFARHLYCLMLLLSEDAYRDQFYSNDNSLTADVKRDLTRRRIAQWAINVVDFRDPDAIMTPFEFDLNPWDGWDCDGVITGANLNSATTPVSYQGDGSSDRIQLIWGCEYPDLLISETFAMHDRRVRDTAWDDHSDTTGPDEDLVEYRDTGDTMDLTRGSTRKHPEYDSDNAKNGDEDLDQTRIPQGSLFVELYCPRNRPRNNEALPRELYNISIDGAQPYEDQVQAHLDLDRLDRTGTYPVWRMAISGPHQAGNTNNARSPLVRMSSHPNSVSFQPENMSILAGVNEPLPIERYVWFTSTAPGGTVASGETPQNTFYNKASRPAEIYPGEYAVIGPRAKTYIGSRPPDDTSDDNASTNFEREPDTRRADQMIDLEKGGAETTWFTDHSGADKYPVQDAADVTEVLPPVTIYAIADPPTTGTWTNVFSTIPEQNGPGLNVSEPMPQSGNYYQAPDVVSVNTGLTDMYGDPDEASTSPNLFPDEPFDDQTGKPLRDDGIHTQNSANDAHIENYKTVFLQRLANPLETWHPVTNPYITIDWMPIDLCVFNGEDIKPSAWATATHGEFDPDREQTDLGKFVARERKPEQGGGLGSTTPAHNKENLFQQRSEPFPVSGGLGGIPSVSGADEYYNWLGSHSIGYLNSPFHGTGGILAPAPGPKSGTAEGDPPKPFPWIYWPDRPLISHNELMLVPASAPNRLLHEISVYYTAKAGTTHYDPGKHFSYRQEPPFNHLLNFYHNAANADGDPATTQGAHFYRIFNFVEVPSRYAGTRNWYYPDDDPSTNIPGLEPPFNYSPAFREPGLVNINTIPSRDVWRSVMGQIPSGAVPVDTFITYPVMDAQRKGTVDALGRFGNPFRSSWAAYNNSVIGQTMLRPAAGSNNPISWAPAVQNQHNASTMNAYFQYQGLQRAGNLVSTQSNVFAVWITVGYFEVDNNGNILRELGADTGEIQRHRGFYLIDRSIPVAYERGMNNNVDNCILLRRFIE